MRPDASGRKGHNPWMPTPGERQYWDEFRKRLVTLRLSLKRGDRSWSQADMAEALDIPLTNYKSYEQRSKFPLHLVDKLALVTHRDVEFIVTGRAPVREFRRRVA